MSVASLIESKLTSTLSPVHLEVLNESYMHSVPEGAETHFKLVVVSATFEGQRLIGRHRAINQLLAEELANGVHALSMHTYTPSEWQALLSVPQSPQCRGGFGH